MENYISKYKIRGAFLVLSVLVTLGGCSEPIKKYHSKRLFSAPAAEDSSAGLRLFWSGAASVVIDDGTHSVLIDPFVSRQENSVFDIVFRRDAVVAECRINERVKRPEIARAKTILVGHSHYDHSLDVAEFARLTKAQVFGSLSTQRILRAHDHTTATRVTANDVLEKDDVDGRFKITVFASKHGNPPVCLEPFGCLNPLSDTVPDSFELPAAVTEYGEGEVYAFFVEHKFGNVLHVGSAGVMSGTLEHLKGQVDVVLLSLVGRGPTEAFLKNIVAAVNPDYVIPIHFDNLFRPLDAETRVAKIAKLSEFFEVMERDYPNVNTGVIPFDEPWNLPHRGASGG